MASNKLDDLHPILKAKAEKFLQLCKEADLPVVIYQTYRSIEEQNDIYAQGRSKPGKKVTNAKGGWSYHNYGLAFDAGPVIDGKIVWNRLDLFKKMGVIGKKVGLEWGGDWHFKDYPHFQWTNGLKIRDLLNGKRPPEII